MSNAPLVPADFAVPEELVTPGFRLEPLGPQHNTADLAAWTAGIEHIRSTPGFEGRDWPPPGGMSAADNLRDLERHAADFRERTGFTYTVLDPVAEGEVLGCLYIYPSRTEAGVTDVRSWVRADRAELDKVLYDAVSEWLATSWPFGTVRYAPR